MLKIGFITAEQSSARINNILHELNEICDVYIYTYEKIDEIKKIYTEHFLQLDGIILGGELPYDIIKQEMKSFPIYTDYITINERDFYALMFSLLANNKIKSSNRLAVDFIGYSNNYLGLEDILSKENFPKFPKRAEHSMIFSYETIKDFHLEQWQNGNVDLSITRYSNIAEHLTKNNIEFIHLYPSKQSILDKFEQTVRQIQMSQLVNNQVAIGMVTTSNKDSKKGTSRRRLLTLRKFIMQLASENHFPFIIEERGDSIEIITSLKDLKYNITQEYTTCLLHNHLKKKTDLTIHIGWGSGDTIHKARHNANKANKKAQFTNESLSYVLTEQEEYIGPLNKDNFIKIESGKDAQIEKWSKKFNISSLQIQKILAVIEQMDTNELSSKDLSFYLDITLRSANRILNNLEEKGIATVSYEKHANLRGRPQKVYTINFS